MNDQHIILDEIDSTNNYLSQLVTANTVLPWTVVSTAYQSQGRGQRSNYWFSSKAKNLLCSIYIKPLFLLPKDQFRLNIILSLAVFDIVDEIIGSGRTKIKWPNDIYVDNLKVAGLLIQNSIQGNKIPQSILGIGLNINENQFPRELDCATSLFLCKGVEMNIDEIRYKVVNQLKAYYSQLISNKDHSSTPRLKAVYTQKLYRLNESALFLDEHNSSFEGHIKGVNELGQLMIDVDHEIRFYSMKEVRFVV